MKLHTKHKWPIRPLVTLNNEFTYADVQWHDSPNEETFIPTIFNSILVQVEMRYKKPYGGSARYKILIDQLMDFGWENVYTDLVSFYPEPSDNQWYPDYRDYELSKFTFGGEKLKFRVTVSIEEGGNLPTGGSGSLGHWSIPESREFTIIFKEMLIKTHKEYIALLEEQTSEIFTAAKKRIKDREAVPKN